MQKSSKFKTVARNMMSSVEPLVGESMFPDRCTIVNWFQDAAEIQDLCTEATNFTKSGLLLIRTVPSVQADAATDAKRRSVMARSMAKSILTDSHFWIPAIVLVVGLVLLVSLR
jgi:hypothetical protein